METQLTEGPPVTIQSLTQETAVSTAIVTSETMNVSMTTKEYLLIKVVKGS